MRPRISDERAPGFSHSHDMCHPHTVRWQSCRIVGEYISICHEKRNGLSGKAENLDKIGFKVPFTISSADKDTVKILNEFQIERT